MNPYLMDAVFWIMAIRGHIPHNGDFRAGPSHSSFGSNRLVWILAVFVVVTAVLSLALWAAVWLAIKLP